MAKKEDNSAELKERFTRDLQTAKRYMDPIHAQMDKYYEMYRNRWSDTSTDFQVSDLFAYVETTVPILTSNRVRGAVHSDYPDYVQHAAALSDILDHTYDVNNWDYESQEVARMAEIYRSAIAYTGWDADYKNGTGKLCVYGVNIRWCYLDPAPTKFEDSSFFFFVEPKRLSEVIKMHPDKADDIKATVNKRDGKTSGDNLSAASWWRSWVRSVKSAITFNVNDKSDMQRLTDYDTMQELMEEEKRKNSVAYIHYWYRDEETDKWKVSYWADDVFLNDMENPSWHGGLPYDIYTPTKDIMSSMGVPMAEHIENLNYEKNVLMDLIVTQAKRAVDPPMMYNTAMGIKDPEALKQKVKEGVVPINNPDFVPLNAIAEFFTPPSLPSYAIDLPDRFDVMNDRLTGVNDSFRGMSDATSGKEVQLKQEAAYTRIKTKVDNFELFNKKIAEKIIINAMQHYKTNRGFRIQGDYTKYEQMPNQDKMPFDVQPIQSGMNDTEQPVYDRTQYFLYANPNEWTKPDGAEGTEMAQDPQAEAKEDNAAPTEQSVAEAYKVLQMTVEIEAGSSLPVSRLARREEAMELFQAGLLDQQAVLESFDWKDRDEVMKRMAEAAKAQQEAEAQAKQAELQQQMQVKQMELQFKQQEQTANHQQQEKVTQMNNDAKTQQTQGKQPQGQQSQQPDVAGGLDALRQAAPQLQQLSDEELMAFISQMNVRQPA